jgi:hypothetical protein
MSLDLRCNNDTIYNEYYILFSGAISDPWNSTYIVVLPLSKGRTRGGRIKEFLFLLFSFRFLIGPIYAAPCQPQQFFATSSLHVGP